MKNMNKGKSAEVGGRSLAEGGKTTDKWHCASFSPASQNAVHPDLPLLASHV